MLFSRFEVTLAGQARTPGSARELRDIGQPVLIGGGMGTTSYILVGTEEGMSRAFSSACHGAARSMSRHQATRQGHGRALVDELASQGILIRSPSLRGLAEEAPGAYKDASVVVEAADRVRAGAQGGQAEAAGLHQGMMGGWNCVLLASSNGLGAPFGTWKQQQNTGETMPYSEQTVQSVRPWSDKTFSFTLSRPQDFAFENGEFVTIGLKREGRLVARAYSIVSTANRDHLEFLSIHVPDGSLTSQLVHIRPGDNVWVNSKATGSLTLNHVLSGRTLYLLATGTGLAPFMSLIRDAGLYARFENVVLVHSVRAVAELAYRDEIEALDNAQLYYVPTVTREAFSTPERGGDLFRSGLLSQRLGLPAPDPEQDRVMICGNPAMTRELTHHLKDSGWTLTNHRGIGNFTTEVAFVVHHE